MSTRSTPRSESNAPLPSITPCPPFGKLTVTEVARWTPPACPLFVAAEEIRFEEPPPEPQPESAATAKTGTSAVSTQLTRRRPAPGPDPLAFLILVIR